MKVLNVNTEFVDSKDQVTPNHIDHTFDIVSPRTSYITYLTLETNPIRKLQARKLPLSKELPSLVEAVKEYSQIAKELEFLKMQMTKEIMTQILESEQVGRKLLLEGRLQMVALFVEVLNPIDPIGVFLHLVAFDIMFF